MYSTSVGISAMISCGVLTLLCCVPISLRTFHFLETFFSFPRARNAVGNDKVGSLNTGNRDVGSDDVNNAIDTREIISRVKPDLLSRLKSVAAGAA